MAENQVLDTKKPLFPLKKYPCVVLLFAVEQHLILCLCSKESGVNLVLVHSIKDVSKLEKLLPFDSYVVKCKG